MISCRNKIFAMRFTLASVPADGLGMHVSHIYIYIYTFKILSVFLSSPPVPALMGLTFDKVCALSRAASRKLR